MAYLGNPPAEAYTNTVKDSFSGDGSTVAFTMSLPTTTNNVRVVVENVIQDPTVAYSCSGTTLTFTSAPPSGTNNIYVVHLGPAVMTTVPPTEITEATTYTSDLTVQGAFTSQGIDDNATSTAMTLDSSGNLQVGTTQTFPAFNNVVGCEVGGFGQISASRDGAEAMQLNRKTSDGNIALFKKDGTTVGSIGSAGSGTEMYIGSSGANKNGIYFTNSNWLAPMQNLAVSDNTQNIGHPSYRWKDLYLSGGVYLGGTGSANYLDDYEEGTWTPAYSTTGVDFSSVTYNTTFTSGTYVKVGRNVTLRGYIRTEALTLGSATGGVIVTGIPFTSSNGVNTITDVRCAGSVLSTNFSADGPSTLVINNNKTYFEPYAHNTIGSGTSAGIVNAADMRTTATSNIMTFTLNYYVD